MSLPTEGAISTFHHLLDNIRNTSLFSSSGQNLGTTVSLSPHWSSTATALLICLFSCVLGTGAHIYAVVCLWRRKQLLHKHQATFGLLFWGTFLNCVACPVQMVALALPHVQSPVWLACDLLFILRTLCLQPLLVSICAIAVMRKRLMLSIFIFEAKPSSLQCQLMLGGMFSGLLLLPFHCVLLYTNSSSVKAERQRGNIIYQLCANSVTPSSYNDTFGSIAAMFFPTQVLSALLFTTFTYMRGIHHLRQKERAISPLVVRDSTQGKQREQATGHSVYSSVEKSPSVCSKATPRSPTISHTRAPHIEHYGTLPGSVVEPEEEDFFHNVLPRPTGCPQGGLALAMPFLKPRHSSTSSEYPRTSLSSPRSSSVRYSSTSSNSGGGNRFSRNLTTLPWLEPDIAEERSMEREDFTDIAGATYDDNTENPAIETGIENSQGLLNSQMFCSSCGATLGDDLGEKASLNPLRHTRTSPGNVWHSSDVSRSSSSASAYLGQESTKSKPKRKTKGKSKRRDSLTNSPALELDSSYNSSIATDNEPSLSPAEMSEKSLKCSKPDNVAAAENFSKNTTFCAACVAKTYIGSYSFSGHGSSDSSGVRNPFPLLQVLPRNDKETVLPKSSKDSSTKLRWNRIPTTSNASTQTEEMEDMAAHYVNSEPPQIRIIRPSVPDSLSLRSNSTSSHQSLMVVMRNNWFKRSSFSRQEIPEEEQEVAQVEASAVFIPESSSGAAAAAQPTNELQLQRATPTSIRTSALRSQTSMAAYALKRSVILVAALAFLLPLAVLHCLLGAIPNSVAVHIYPLAQSLLYFSVAANPFLYVFTNKALMHELRRSQ